MHIRYTPIVAGFFTGLLLSLSTLKVQASGLEDEVDRFYQCTWEEFDHPVITAEIALQIGHCFSHLLDTGSGQTGLSKSMSLKTEPSGGISPHIVLQYADSWYTLAETLGSSKAARERNQIRTDLSNLLVHN